MRTKVTLFLALAIVMMVGCDELLNLIKFNTGDYAFEFKMDPTTAGTHIIDEDTVTTSIEELLAENDVSADDLKEATLKKANITILSGADNFNKLDTVKIYIGALGMPYVIAGASVTIPKDTNQYALPINNVNMLDYLTAKDFWVRFEATLNEDVTDTVYFETTLNFELSL